MKDKETPLFKRIRMLEERVAKLEEREFVRGVFTPSAFNAGLNDVKFVEGEVSHYRDIVVNDDLTLKTPQEDGVFPQENAPLTPLQRSEKLTADRQNLEDFFSSNPYPNGGHMPPTQEDAPVVVESKKECPLDSSRAVRTRPDFRRHMSPQQITAMQAIFDLHEAVESGLTVQDLMDVVDKSVEDGLDRLEITLSMCIVAIKAVNEGT